MTTAECLPRRPGPRPERFTPPESLSVASRMRAAFGSAWHAWWRHRAERATILMLHSLDDRALRDIGMDRSEIESVVYGAREDCRVARYGATPTARSRAAERRLDVQL